jgi:hypothetical protein
VRIISIQEKSYVPSGSPHAISSGSIATVGEGRIKRRHRAGTSSFPFIIEGPEERRKEMSGRKYALWAVAISAALLTAGLTLSCGDENGENGGAAVICQDACEKLNACGVNKEIFGLMLLFGWTVADCLEACEDELAGGGGSLAEIFACIPDSDCWDIPGTCLCKPACENLFDCGIYLWWGSTAECVAECEVVIYMEDIFALYLFTCPLRFSSCQFIDEFCSYFL